MADKAPKKRGRPKGSKNKAKSPEPDLQTAAEAGAAGVDEPLEGQQPIPGTEVPKYTPPGEAAGTRTPRKRRVSKAVTRQIEDALKEVLQAPAMPCAIFGDEWAADHFEQAGEVFANKIAVVSERHPVLRRWLENSLEGESIAVLMLAGLAYAGPPLIHWNLLPAPGLKQIPRKSGSRFRRKNRDEGSPADGTVWPGAGETQPEKAAPVPRAAPEDVEAAMGGPAMAAEFSNGDGPPLFTEVPAE